MKLYFLNSQDVHKFVGNATDENQAIKLVRDFCDERGFVINYYRAWVKDGKKWFDVGSHSEFFYLILDK